MFIILGDLEASNLTFNSQLMGTGPKNMDGNHDKNIVQTK